MPKAKPTSKKKSVARQATTKPTVKTKSKTVKKQAFSEEYKDYLQRYEMYGEGRPRLSPEEFDRYDDELLDLLAQEMEHGLDDEQIIRVKELEYLLLDSEQ
jgi:hypothetical protein